MIKDIIEIKGRELGRIDFQTDGNTLTNIEGHYFKGKNVINVLLLNNKKELER
jgi:hypothetical protein